MSDRSAIEWCDASWNPVTGCTQVSPGCDHCYALAFAERFRGVPDHPYEQGFDLRLWPERLDLPLKWKRPRRIFVNSMSDLFHQDVPDEFIRRVFDVMSRADWHNYLILTKRPHRLARLAQSLDWPRHVWAGVSVENDRYLWRVDLLRRVPAAVRFVSAEPLLGPLDGIGLDGINWLIVGGESGIGHRPCDVDWVRRLRDQCTREGVAFFLKQWGGRTPKAGGRTLDGRTWDEYPQPTLKSGELRVATQRKVKRTGEVGEWSAEKLDLLRCYLGGNNQRGGFLPATTSAHRRYYIDLFAGPGEDKIRETGQVIDGSPLIALKAGPPEFTGLYFVDADPKNGASLEAHRDDFLGRSVQIFCGDANVEVDHVLARLATKYPAFAFLDPRGSELRWETVTKLARHKLPTFPKIELFILFAYNQGLVRFMPYDPTKMVNHDELDRVMPDAMGWRRIYAQRVSGEAGPNDIRRAMLDEYVQGLKALGYKYVPPPRLIATPGGHPLYFMIFASDHPAGGKIMEWCLRSVRDCRLQKSFIPYDQRY